MRLIKLQIAAIRVLWRSCNMLKIKKIIFFILFCTSLKTLSMTYNFNFYNYTDKPIYTFVVFLDQYTLTPCSKRIVSGLKYTDGIMTVPARSMGEYKKSITDNPAKGFITLGVFYSFDKNGCQTDSGMTFNMDTSGNITNHFNPASNTCFGSFWVDDIANGAINYGDPYCDLNIGFSYSNSGQNLISQIFYTVYNGFQGKSAGSVSGRINSNKNYLCGLECSTESQNYPNCCDISNFNSLNNNINTQINNWCNTAINETI